MNIINYIKENLDDKSTLNTNQDKVWDALKALANTGDNTSVDLATLSMILNMDEQSLHNDFFNYFQRWLDLGHLAMVSSEDTDGGPIVVELT